MSWIDRKLKKIGLVRIKMLETIVAANSEDSDCWLHLTKDERQSFKNGLETVIGDLNTAIMDWKI